MDKMYSFRYDPTYPLDTEKDTEQLSSHDGMLCSADIDPRSPITTMTTITFQDGYKTSAFIYELEEVTDEK